MQTTDQMIQEMVVAIGGPNGSPRRMHYLKSSLNLLVCMAKAEYAGEIKNSVALAVDTTKAAEGRRKGKALARELLATLQSKQTRLDFEQNQVR